GYCEMLLDEEGTDSPADRNGDLLRIRKASEDLLALLDDLQDISRVESGEIVLSPHRVDIASLIQEVADQFQPQALKVGNHIEVNTAANLGMMIADGRRLKQILLNVVGNSIKYT